MRHGLSFAQQVDLPRGPEVSVESVVSLPGTRVFVVEDEALLRLTVCDGLAFEGYEVLAAATADEAIEILESRNDISTIFTDIEMPGSMDGLRLAAVVRDRWPPVNIVVTSGKMNPRGAQMPKNAQFIGKPYQTADVLSALRAFV